MKTSKLLPEECREEFVSGTWVIVIFAALVFVYAAIVSWSDSGAFATWLCLVGAICQIDIGILLLHIWVLGDDGK